jgi:hypothetical protein
MESLSCRSPANCRSCEHFGAGVGCVLEMDVDLALDALAVAARPPARIPVRVGLRASALA